MIDLNLWSSAALIWAGGGLLALGGGLLLALQTHPALRGTIRTVWPEYRVLVGVFLLIALMAIWGGVLALPILVCIGGRIGWELAQTRTDASQTRVWTMAAVGAGLPLVPLPMEVIGALWAALAVILVAVPSLRHVRDISFLIYPGLPLALLSSAASDPYLTVGLLAALLLSETFDSYALLSGRLFGKRPLAPRLSPKKTIEGVVGGGIMLSLTAGAAALVAQDIALAPAMAVAAMIGGATLAGDLAASMIKRRAGIKDFAPLVPPQGGLLDVLDGWIAAAALMTCLLALF